MRGKMDCHGASDIGLKRNLNTVIVSRFVDSNSAAELVVETAENSVEAEFDPMTDTLPMGEQKLVEPQTATERTQSQHVPNTRQKEFEMRFFNRLTAITLAVLFSAAGIGCSNDIDQEDVDAAREELIEEERETQIAIQESQETIAEEEEETAAVRRKIENPDRSQLLEEERETAEAREEAEQKIREEKQETREARKKLVELETRLAAQRARDSYLTEREVLLTTATLKIEELKNEAAEQNGTNKAATEKKIQKLQAAHEELADAVAEMKNADPLEWQVEKAATEAAYVELQQVLQDTSP